VDEAIDPKLEIYPNPASGRLAVIDDLIQSVRIIDNQGSLILEATKELHTIDVSDLKSGMYYLQIMYKDGRIARNKIIKI